MTENSEYGALEIPDNVAVRIAGYLLLDESRWDNMYGFTRMPDTDLLDGMPNEVRKVIKASKRLLDFNDPEATRIRRLAIAREIHRALENATDTLADACAARGFLKDLAREHSVACELIQKITNDEDFIAEFVLTLELDTDNLEVFDDDFMVGHSDNISHAREMVDRLLDAGDSDSIHRRIDGKAQYISEIHKSGIAATSLAMDMAPISDTKLAEIMSYRKKMTAAFRQSGATPERIAKFEGLMGPDERIMNMAECATQAEGDELEDWLHTLRLYAASNHDDAIDYASEVLTS